MSRKINSVRIRVKPLCRREFERDVYCPGTISLSRLVWGSIGSGLALAVVVVLSNATGVAVLIPPLAATCFIHASCVYLRVARPKPVIIGHVVAALGGMAGIWLGELLAGGTGYVIPLKFGLALFFASFLMQIFDADHPPAAATAVIPVVLPLPMPAYLFPIYMAWGASVAVLVALIWNRVWFEFPAPDKDHHTKYAGLYMEKPQVWGTGLCLVSMVLMCCQQVIPLLYSIGLVGMSAGVLLLGGHHLATALVKPRSSQLPRD